MASTDPDAPLCYKSEAGCKRPGLGPYHYCEKPADHRDAHVCACGVAFVPRGEQGNAFEGGE
jgi:hypothetical protein